MSRRCVVDNFHDIWSSEILHFLSNSNNQWKDTKVEKSCDVIFNHPLPFSFILHTRLSAVPNKPTAPDNWKFFYPLLRSDGTVKKLVLNFHRKAFSKLFVIFSSIARCFSSRFFKIFWREINIFAILTLWWIFEWREINIFATSLVLLVLQKWRHNNPLGFCF